MRSKIGLQTNICIYKNPNITFLSNELTVLFVTHMYVVFFNLDKNTAINYAFISENSQQRLEF